MTAAEAESEERSEHQQQCFLREGVVVAVAFRFVTEFAQGRYSEVVERVGDLAQRQEREITGFGVLSENARIQGLAD